MAPQARAEKGRNEPLDIVSLSLGFYPEYPDRIDELPLHDLVADFARHNVALVCSAGNDATSAIVLPAGYARASMAAPQDPPGPEIVGAPIAAVAALNPGEATVALFSNDGDWVTDLRSGVNVVSSYPCLLYTSRCV